ncbi:MAG TPA: single-stranded DNA-binding protein [Candidatus Margulisbacteria bacterium]|nr:MAG: hypothetical protein A2X42_03175 [Candidatus Margulisbacteria bacterium GWF2_38_17]OGI09935.1 MAG: hypothetical protein A2X41_05990 [Candidatus Margulisbacteria bacterium GWE2_39_32]HCT84303.1 single-stranded DNA-binding protein [Candidatus Margulisiibacteriota bacterium]
MKGYNHVTLVGNLVKDPDKKSIGTSQKTSFVLAVSRNYKKNDEQEVDFIPIISWGKLAEICGEYLNKGKRILVDGKIQIRNYEKDDQKKWVTEIVADEITILSALEKDKDSNKDN